MFRTEYANTTSGVNAESNVSPFIRLMNSHACEESESALLPPGAKSTASTALLAFVSRLPAKPTYSTPFTIRAYAASISDPFANSALP